MTEEEIEDLGRSFMALIILLADRKLSLSDYYEEKRVQSIKRWEEFFCRILLCKGALISWEEYKR